MDNVNAVNDNKLAALTNEPVKVMFGGEEFTLRRPTIRDYKKIRSYLKEKGANTEGRLPDDEAIDFGIFFIATLLEHPKYSQDELEDRILVSDLVNLQDMMVKLGFTTPQSQTAPQEVKLTPLADEKLE